MSAVRSVLRVDAEFQAKEVKTSDGFIRTIGRIAAPGVMIYHENGREIRELVPRETLEDPEYMASHEGLPYLDEHPPNLHIKIEEVGVIRPLLGGVGPAFYADADGADGEGLYVPLYINTPAGKKAYESGKRYLSPAYLADVKEEPGVHPVHGPYDTIQIKRKNPNHVAGVEDPRGGTGMKIKADSATGATEGVGVQVGVIRADSNTPPQQPTPPSPPAPAQGGGDMSQLIALMEKSLQKQDEMLVLLKGKADGDNEEPPGDAPKEKMVADNATIERMAAELNTIRTVAERAGVTIPQGTGILASKRMILQQRFPNKIKADSKAAQVEPVWDVFVDELDESSNTEVFKNLGSGIIAGAKIRADGQRKETQAAVIPALSELPEVS